MDKIFTLQNPSTNRLKFNSTGIIRLKLAHPQYDAHLRAILGLPIPEQGLDSLFEDTHAGIKEIFNGVQPYLICVSINTHHPSIKQETPFLGILMPNLNVVPGLSGFCWAQ